MDKIRPLLAFLGILLIVDIYFHISILRSVQPIYEEVFKAEIIATEAEKYFQKTDPAFPSIQIVRGPYLYWQGDVSYNSNTNIISIFIGENLLTTMSRDETKAFIFHALGHYKSGHLQNSLIKPWRNCDYECAIKEEIEADLFAIEDGHGVDSTVLTLLINRLAFNRGEASSRINAIIIKKQA